MLIGSFKLRVVSDILNAKDVLSYTPILISCPEALGSKCSIRHRIRIKIKSPTFQPHQADQLLDPLTLCQQAFGNIH